MSKSPEGAEKDEETYQTTESPSSYLVETQIDMTRRFFKLGRKNPSRQRRMMVWALYLVIVGFLAVMAVSVVIFAVRAIGDW